MIIRKATLNDADAITTQNILLATESEEISLSYETVFTGVKSLLSDPNKGFYVVAEENNKIIGQIMITFEWSDWRNTTIWWIQSVYVQKRWRKKGAFSKLFEYIQQQALYSQVHILRLYTHKNNIIAQKIYQHIGMEKQPYVIFQHNIIS
jgi:RimJ/RimL family protein N-acetyltransferase